MARYRKKPVVIEAMRYDGSHEMTREIVDWARGSKTPAYVDERILPSGEGMKSLSINTLEGAMWVDTGDWVICGVKGEFYPCKPDIFEATYELAE